RASTSWTRSGSVRRSALAKRSMAAVMTPIIRVIYGIMTSLQDNLRYMLATFVKGIQDDGASRLDVRGRPDPLQQILERPGGRDAHQQDVAFFAGHRVTRFDLLDVFQAGGRIIGLRGIQRSDGHERRQWVPDRLRVDARRVSRDHA